MSYLTLNLLSGFVVGAVAVLLNMPTQVPERKYKEAVRLVKYFILGFSAGLVVLPLGTIVQHEAVNLMKQYPEFLIQRGLKILTGVAGITGFVIGLSLGRKKAPEQA